MLPHSFLKYCLSRHSRWWVATVIVVLQSTAVTADTTMPLFKAHYEADIKGFRVKASRELTRQNDKQYTLLFKASSVIASLEEISTIRWEDNLLRPVHYSYLQNVIGKKDERYVDFNHHQKLAESRYQGEKHQIPYSAQLLDTLSYQLQLQQDLRDNKNHLHYSVINKGKVKHNEFKREKEEVLTTELGKLRTTKVSLSRDSDKRQTYIWFAKDWDYLLVRFEQHEKGKKEFVINLTDATIGHKNIEGLTE